MAKQQVIGNSGEDKAAEFLYSLGYIILERNWRYSKAEIDIIAMDGKVLVFVEVKTKSYTYFGQPEESISPTKEKLIVDAANRYMQKIHHEWEIRFDIISVVIQKDKSLKATHFKDAFFPGLE